MDIELRIEGAVNGHKFLITEKGNGHTSFPVSKVKKCLIIPVSFTAALGRLLRANKQIFFDFWLSKGTQKIIQTVKSSTLHYFKSLDIS